MFDVVISIGCSAGNLVHGWVAPCGIKVRSGWLRSVVRHEPDVISSLALLVLGSSTFVVDDHVVTQVGVLDPKYKLWGKNKSLCFCHGPIMQKIFILLEMQERQQMNWCHYLVHHLNIQSTCVIYWNIFVI